MKSSQSPKWLTMTGYLVPRQTPKGTLGAVTSQSHLLNHTMMRHQQKKRKFRYQRRKMCTASLHNHPMTLPAKAALHLYRQRLLLLKMVIRTQTMSGLLINRTWGKLSPTSCMSQKILRINLNLLTFHHHRYCRLVYQRKRAL